MTFDDGILTIYTVVNRAALGDKPVYGLIEKMRSYFSYQTLGINRYYTALQADQQISAVVAVPAWDDIRVTDVCALEDGTQYTIMMVQAEKDEMGLRIMRLSLERVKQNYVLPRQSEAGAADSNG